MPFPFLMLALLAASMVLGELFKPRPKDSSRPASLREFNIPTADETRPIPVIWGTVNMDAPNVIWYGDLRTIKITKRVRSSIFSHSDLTLGFKYFLGLHYAFCYGPVDKIIEVNADEKIAWTGDVANGTFLVDARELFGGASQEQLEATGEGGLYAECEFYPGDETQTPNTYIDSILGSSPAYRGVSHLVWKGPSSGATIFGFYSGYIGATPNLKPIAFVLKRLPNFINTLYHDISNGDANPADVLYELLVNERYGMGLPSSYIDVPSFQVMQQTLYEEGLGYSAIWDSQKQISEVIDEVLRFIDGVLYTDLVTGLITVKLARNDYDVTSLVEFNEDNISEVTNFSRSAWDETTNEVQITYIDRFNRFKQRPGLAQDLANSRIQGAVVSTNIAYAGCSNGTVAAKLALRDLRVLSTPLAQATFKLNREAIDLRPGSVFKWSWDNYGIQSMVMRVLRIRYGELLNGVMELDAVQDVFQLSTNLYGAPAGTGWTNPAGPAVAPSLFLVEEAPFFLSSDSQFRLNLMASQPDVYQLAFNGYASINAGVSYTKIGSSGSFAPTGLSSAGYGTMGAISADVDPGSITFTPSTPNNFNLLHSVDSGAIAQGSNLFIMNNEIMAFETIVNNGNGTYTISNIWRGLLDTTPKTHASGSRAWFFTDGNLIPDWTFDSGQAVLVKLESVARTSVSALSAASGLTIARRALKPLPPGFFKIDGSTSSLTVANGSNDVTITWEQRNRLTQDTVRKQFDTGIIAEGETTYFIKIFNASNTLLRTVSDLTTTTYTYTAANQTSDNGSLPLVLTFQLYSKRDGLFSFQAQQRTVTRTGGVAPSAPAYSPGSDTYNPPPAGNALALQRIPVATTTPTNGQVLTYNTTTGKWEPSTVATTLAGDVTGPSGSNTVVKIQNNPVLAGTPSNGQILTYITANNRWEPTTSSAGTVTSFSAGDFSPLFTTTEATVTTTPALSFVAVTQAAKKVYIGPISGSDAAPTFRLLENTDLSNAIFGASGGSHNPGAVPDPGSSVGTTKFLREDGAWVVPSGSGTITGSGTTDKLSIWTSSSALGDSIVTQKSSRLGVNVSSVFTTDGAQFQVNETAGNLAGYSFSNWSSSGNKVPTAIFCPTNNGGSSPASAFPALILGRDGVSGQSYTNLAEFQISRYENSGTNARTKLSIVLSDGSFDTRLVISAFSSGAVGFGMSSSDIAGSKVSAKGGGIAAGATYSLASTLIAEEGAIYAEDFFALRTVNSSGNRARLQILDRPAQLGSYSYNSWNGSGQKVPVAIAVPTNNGGNTPNGTFPGIVLAREGIAGEAFGNFAEIKIGRYEDNGTNARTELTLACTEGGGPGSGTDILRLLAQGYVIIAAANAAPTDSWLANGQVAFYLDQTNGLCKIRAKYSDGTLKTGSITLS